MKVYVELLCDVQSSPLDLIDTGKGLKVQSTAPHLVSLGSGRLSVAITVLPLKEGESLTDESHQHHVFHIDLFMYT